MSHRINRAIALLEIRSANLLCRWPYRHILTHEQGQQDAHTWADYINVGMEHGAFDMAGLEAYMHGLVDSGPHAQWPPHPDGDCRSPRGRLNELVVRYNAWQFRQILARGVHGVLLCQAESADAVRAFVSRVAILFISWG